VVPNLQVDDPAAAGELYTEVLGLQPVMDHGWIRTLAAPDDPLVQISLIVEDASAPVTPQVSIEVEDVDAVHAEAVKLGFEIVHPLTDEPWGVRRFFVRDRDGNLVNVLGHPQGDDPQG
jgi:catechol 2,3-dioxygenase-like lactoylglutathione lyase family enzyme